MKINMATKITIFRVFLIPVVLIVLLFPYDKYAIDTNIELLGLNFYVPYFVALIIFTIASISDAVDGYIARSTNTITNLGKFLDPVADKLLVNSLLIFLVSTNHLPALIVIIMISRDVMVDALRMICIENKIVIAASIYGKLKTVFQMVMIALVLLVALPNEKLPDIILFLAYLTTFISIISGVDYFMKNIKYLRN